MYKQNGHLFRWPFCVSTKLVGYLHLLYFSIFLAMLRLW